MGERVGFGSCFWTRNPPSFPVYRAGSRTRYNVRMGAIKPIRGPQSSARNSERLSASGGLSPATMTSRSKAGSTKPGTMTKTTSSSTFPATGTYQGRTGNGRGHPPSQALQGTARCLVASGQIAIPLLVVPEALEPTGDHCVSCGCTIEQGGRGGACRAAVHGALALAVEGAGWCRSY